MDVMRAAAAPRRDGAEVLHLEVGQPSTAAPRRVIEAAQRALVEDKLGYTVALGLEELRERIARHYAETYGVHVDPGNVVVTTGSSGAFLLAFLASFAAGDRVGVTAPGYPAVRHILTVLGIEAVALPVDAATRFQPTATMIEGLALDGVVVASPANPTGSMIAKAGLVALAQRCRERGIRLVSDEIYHGLTYGEPAWTVAGIDGAITINSFSKTYSMTGWRLGWMVLPDDLVRPVECLAQNLFISPPSLSQRAALVAFDCQDELAANLDRYRRNRDILGEGLPDAGFPILCPAEGAFYFYADVSRWTEDSVTFCQRMLADTGVAATPGVDFDAEGGRRTVRFSFSGSTATMVAAVARLKAWRK